jgi:Protein of unknown function
MNIAGIDEAILSAAGERWTKVAMVIAKVAHASSELSASDEGYQLISDHIETLIRDGRLAAQGNTRNL